MDLIFENGEKLYLKHNPVMFIETFANNKLHSYQTEVLNKMFKKNYNDKVYGDDFLIEIGDKKNINRDIVIKITDFDENQKQEADIRICFSEKELGQFISLLQNHYDCLGIERGK